MSRLNKVLLEQDFDSYGDYIEFVKSDTSGSAVNELINRITTNHTFFFRENKHFEFFLKKRFSLILRRVTSTLETYVSGVLGAQPAMSPIHFQC